MFSLLSLPRALFSTTQRKRVTKKLRQNRKKKLESNRLERLDNVPQRPLVIFEALGRARHEQRKDLARVERDRGEVGEVRPCDLVVVKLLLGPFAPLRLLVRRGRQSVLQVVVGAGKAFERPLDVSELELLVVLARAAESDDVGLLDCVEWGGAVKEENERKEET